VIVPMFCFVTGNPIKPKERPDWIPLEISHKGQLHKLHKMIQEEQGEVECYV